MYAYIKYLNGPKMDRKLIVPTSKLKNFNKDAHQKLLKYKIIEGENAYSVTILLLKDTKKELEEIIKNKRIGDNPTHLLVSADETGDKNKSKSLKRSRTNLEMQKNESMVKNKLQKLTSMQNLMNSSFKNPSLLNNIDKVGKVLQSNQSEVLTIEDKLSEDSSLVIKKPDIAKTKEFKKSTKPTIPGGSSTKVQSLPLKNKKSGDHRPDKTNKIKDLPMKLLNSSFENSSLLNNDDKVINVLQDESNRSEVSTEDELSEELSVVMKEPGFAKTEEFQKSTKPTMPGGSSTKVKSLPLKNKKSGDHKPDKTNKKKDLPTTPDGSPTKVESLLLKDKKSGDDHPEKTNIQKVHGSNSNLPSSLIDNKKSSHLPQKKLGFNQEKDSFKNSNVPKITNMCDVHPIGECNEKLQKLIYTNESLKKENQSLKTEFRELKAESTRLKHGKSKLKETVKGLETELNTVRQLNIDLQKSIIEKTTERDSMMENLVSRQANVTYSDNFPAIATLRTTDNIRRIHIGRDIWIPEKDYNTVLNNSKTPSQCTSNILIKAFDMNDLLKGTKTGFESNRTGSGKKECIKLDDKTFGACEDFYIYWMKNTYKPTKEQKKTLLSDMAKFDYFAARKIAELKRPSRTPNSKGNKSKKLPKKKIDTFVDVDETFTDRDSSDEAGKEENEDPLENEETEDPLDITKNKNNTDDEDCNNEEKNDYDETDGEEKHDSEETDGEENHSSKEKEDDVDLEDQGEKINTDTEFDWTPKNSDDSDF